LAIRVICTKSPYGLDNADAVIKTVAPLCQPHGLSPTVLPVQSVGVQGDFRSYRQPLVLSGAVDALDWPSLQSLSQRLTNECHQLNRVAIVLNSERALPSVIKSVTPTTLTPAVTKLLCALDHTVTTKIADAGKLALISQLLTVLVPIDTSHQGQHSVVIRGVVTNDYMTARSVTPGLELPWDLLHDLEKTLRRDFPIDLVMLDITAKPPATVEWE
jgi:GMP synthase (glutamine-hydrolysing)